jgi:hypothetical protein
MMQDWHTCRDSLLQRVGDVVKLRPDVITLSMTIAQEGPRTPC